MWDDGPSLCCGVYAVCAVCGVFGEGCGLVVGCDAMMRKTEREAVRVAHVDEDAWPWLWLWLCGRFIRSGRGYRAPIAIVRAHPGVLRRLDGLDLRVADPHLPLELKGADNSTIFDYYRDLLSEPSVVSRRCRVMLLGNGGVGKTTLAQRLVTGSVTPPGTTTTTHGVLQRASKQFSLDHA